MGKQNIKNKGKMSQSDKMSQCGKEAARNSWKYVTDGQNVANQVKEGGHDVTIDNMSTVRQGWK
jgi:hypothetical protein